MAWTPDFSSFECTFLVVSILAIVLAVSRLSTFFFNRASKKNSLSPGKENVFITGCDSGIGFQSAAFFDRQGFRVFAGCLAPTGHGARRLLEDCPNVKIVHLDVTDEEIVKRAYETISADTEDGGLWALMNNAGVLCYGEFEWNTMNQCQKQIDVNLTGAIRITKTFLPLVKKRKGRILMMSSVNGLVAYPFQAVYCATKYALEGFCNSLRLELRKSSVPVVSIQLGDFARLTNIFSAHDKDVEEMWAHMDEETRKEQGKYFWKFHDLAKEKHGLTCPSSFNQSPLFADLKDAIMSEQPKSRYKCMPIFQKAFVLCFSLLPARFTDYLMHVAFSKVFSSRD